MGREFELKFSADAQQQQRILGDFSGNWIPFYMETTYYDTPDGTLGRLHWTLRRRFENGISVCTLKTPDPNGGRGEWEVHCDSIETAVPMLCKLGAPETLALYTAGGVTEVCGARFRRQALTLTEDGCVLELALDSGVLLGGGRELALCEVEVELKDGPDEMAMEFARRLAAQYALRPEKKSKYRRALQLAKGER